MRLFGSVIGLLIMASTITGWSGEWYVAPDGNDANPGTEAQPLATLARARDLVREQKSRGQEPMRVVLRGGIYRLQKPIVFGPEDSGSQQYPVTYEAYPNEQPIISGSVPITGWKRGEDGVWTVEIPEVKSGQWYFRQLFVNGQRRARARLPSEGLYQTSPGAATKRSFTYQAGQLDPHWRNLRDVEVVALQYWTEGRLRIESLDEASHLATFTGDAFRPLSWNCGWYVENVAEGLRQPGQWYLDRTSGVLSYRPMATEEIETFDVVAPVIRNWLQLQGDYSNGQLVEHLVFRGLSFQHTSWDLDEELGYSYPQAAIELVPGDLLWAGHPQEGLTTPQSQIEVPAGIHARGAHHVCFEGNEFTHTGGWGINLGPGCADNVVVGNTWRDMGAGGIRVGSPHTTFRDEEEARRTTISDNTFQDGCAVFLGSPAIWIGMSSGNRIAHNEISGKWQWAISVGFQWGYMPPQNARDNIVEYNHCHHVCNAPLQTHAVIYLLGVQPGTVVRYNHVHHCTGAHGICLDNSSAGILVEHNVVHHGQRGALVFNFNDLGNIIQNNIFALAQQGQMFRYGDAGKLDQTGILYRNIFYWQNDRLFNRDTWPNYDIVMDYNLYYDASAAPITFLGFTLDEWREKGLDTHSVVADPLFVDPANGDFTLRPDSPALALGFKPIDIRPVGPRPEGARHALHGR